MSWHCSLALVEEFLEGNFLDGELCAQLKSIRTARKSYCDAKKRGTLKPFQYGTTYERLMAGRGVEKWMSSLRASRASHSALQAREKADLMNATSGPIPSGSFAKWDHASRCWKTSQVSLLTRTLVPFSGSWPRAGMTRTGAVYRQPNWERRIGGIGSGLWPTASARDWKSGKASDATLARNARPLNAVVFAGGPKIQRTWATPQARDGNNRGSQRKRYENPARSNDLPDQIGKGQLNPDWVEWLMAWPIGWTALEPLATDRFQQWLRGHGNCCVGQAKIEAASGGLQPPAAPGSEIGTGEHINEQGKD